jgi:hypothetical protein
MSMGNLRNNNQSSSRRLVTAFPQSPRQSISPGSGQIVTTLPTMPSITTTTSSTAPLTPPSEIRRLMMENLKQPSSSQNNLRPSNFRSRRAFLHKTTSSPDFEDGAPLTPKTPIADRGTVSISRKSQRERASPRTSSSSQPRSGSKSPRRNTNQRSSPSRDKDGDSSNDTQQQRCRSGSRRRRQASESPTGRQRRGAVSESPVGPRRVSLSQSRLNSAATTKLIKMLESNTNDNSSSSKKATALKVRPRIHHRYPATPKVY